MTTTTEKLEALAQAHEQKAAALRLAIAELTGHATTTKAPKINGMLTAAVALRERQRPATQERATAEDMERHHGIIRAYLARQATWVGSRPLWEELQRQGEVMPYSRAQKLVQRLAARGELARRGERHYTQYQMKPHTKKKPPSKPPHTHPRASADGHKTAIIVGLVRDAKGPVTIKELVPLARAAGVASLTGMYNYVTQGYLRKAKKNGHRAYAFVAMPPAPPAPSSSSAS